MQLGKFNNMRCRLFGKHPQNYLCGFWFAFQFCSVACPPRRLPHRWRGLTQPWYRLPLGEPVAGEGGPRTVKRYPVLGYAFWQFSAAVFSLQPRAYSRVLRRGLGYRPSLVVRCACSVMLRRTLWAVLFLLLRAPSLDPLWVLA